MSPSAAKWRFTLRQLFLWMALAAVPLTAVGCLVRLNARWNEAERTVTRASINVEELGGHITKGLVNGTFYVHLENCPLTDKGLADLAVELRAFPPRGWTKTTTSR